MTRRATRRRGVGTVLAGLTLAVLAVAGPSPAQGAEGPPDASPASALIETSSTELAVPTSAPCPGGTHEGCYGYDDMRGYLEQMVALVVPMFDRTYGTQSRPTVVFVPAGGSGPLQCVTRDGSRGSFDSLSFLYCPAEATIYLGQDRLWEFYSLGDAAPAFGVAHEWGHHVQMISNVALPRSPAESVVLENQADCVAGAWLSYADEAGQLEYPDDLADVEAILQRIGAAEGPNRDHGTVAERTEAVQLGYDSGLAGCNDYLPETPIYAP